MSLFLPPLCPPHLLCHPSVSLSLSSHSLFLSLSLSSLSLSSLSPSLSPSLFLSLFRRTATRCALPSVLISDQSKPFSTASPIPNLHPVQTHPCINHQIPNSWTLITTHARPIVLCIVQRQPKKKNRFKIRHWWSESSSLPAAAAVEWIL